jgi:hypothetical protein
MRRHLPLLGSPASAASPDESLLASRVALGPGSIGVCDTDEGVSAVRFASELALALGERGATATLTVLGSPGVPTLERPLTDLLDAAGVAPRLVAVSTRGASLSALPPWPRGVSLWVGLPALAAYRPVLSVLLQADRSIGSWPPVLRAIRPSCQLELASLRPGLARALADALIKRGFLPGG